MIERPELHEEIVRLTIPGTVSAADDVVSVPVLITGRIIAVVGSLAAGTGTTTLELNVRAPGAAKAVVGTVNVATTGPALMASIANTTVNAGDELILDCNAAGTTPTGAGLLVLIQR